MKRWRKWLLIISSGILIATASILTTVDRSPVIESTHYQSTIGKLEKLNKKDFSFSGDTLRVGWAKVNLTPVFQTSLAGYGIQDFEDIADSIWMRVFVFDNGLSSVVLLAPDLLIFPPKVKESILNNKSIKSLQGVFFSATHTHHSIGNWHPGIVGRLFAGPFDQKVVDLISEKAIYAISLATQNLKKSRIGFSAINTEGLVRNRVDPNGDIDPWLRIIKFEQDGGETAVLASFSAHPTTIPRDSAVVHRDYPGILVDLLEDNVAINFGAFIAGAVGSQGTITDADPNPTKAFAINLADQINLISNVIQTSYHHQLGFKSLNIELGEPQFRISENLRIRPWLFEQIFGRYTASMQLLRIGDTLIVGTPCDFSGELVQPLDHLAREKGINFILSSFNGDYVGYITRDDLYDQDAYETRTMNWFGPDNGNYFSQIISKLINLQYDSGESF
ncbi:MAG: neutral/alkaline non-lysosomal ceramidase N-terminal domain-containing protein [Bacteroidetes bacterium]|nr:neutral/alkaline non-lysosomal ceramidase N-terminal domain-containing protein [Bacteroidota bacterium]MDA1119345.1 neutral/alkaline non-lysosomal ceramidase N-terminal domain-containing protein [Bacteroidota bacterium]